jgi:hypothetical protein
VCGCFELHNTHIHKQYAKCALTVVSLSICQAHMAKIFPRIQTAQLVFIQVAKDSNGMLYINTHLYNYSDIYFFQQ